MTGAAAEAPRCFVDNAASGSFGASLRAGRAFHAGEVVLEERPLMLLDRSAAVDAVLLGAVCEASGLVPEEDMARKIAGVLGLCLSADAAARAALRKCFGQPDECAAGMAEFVMQLVQDVQRLHMPLAASDAQELAHAVMVFLLSAHTTDAGSAIFEIGHRCNHSCSPNVFFQNSNGSEPGGLVFTAIRPIESGELLHMSYLEGKELMAPAVVRRQLLSARKSFECACARCVAEEREHGEAATSEAAVLAEQPELVSAALAGTLKLAALDRDTCRGHWIFATALFADGLGRLRGGVEQGDTELARSSFKLVRAFFEWVLEKYPAHVHFASSQAAECFACLAAMEDEEAAVLASQLCAPYLNALENEFGALDAENVRMRAWLKSHCGHCGRSAQKGVCSRCKIVGYCGAECQRAAWKAHKPLCTASQ